MKFIMYHYVRKFSSQFPRFKYLDFSDFIKQLDYFEQEFGFVKREDFESALADEEKILPTGAVLTFDDSLKDHYTYVLPELNRRGLWGIFFIPALPYNKKDFLDVHKIHLILGSADSTDILKKMTDLITDNMLTDQGRKEYQSGPYAMQIHDDTTKIKRILNYYIDYAFRPEVIQNLCDEFCAQETQPEEFYMSFAEMREMQERGMIIGSHGYGHKVFSKMSKNDQESDIVHANEVLKPILDREPLKFFCYPYGGAHSFTKETEALLNKHGYNYAISVDPQDITREDLNSNPFSLPRFDCNQFPHGAISG